MYRHDRLDASVVLSKVSEIVQINRNQTGLPVMTVDQLRPEPDHRKDTQYCL